MTKSDGRDYVIQWNNRFPLDRWWREKWKIPLFSKQHLEVDPISQVLEYIEDKEFESVSEKIKLEIEKEDRLKQTGKLLSNVKNNSISDDELRNIDIGDLYSNIETE
jgi:hypothetical protein